MLTTLILLVSAAPTLVDQPQVAQLIGPNHHYVGNRVPLAPTPFLRLVPGQVRPMGWLLKQLTLEAEGFSGRLTEISPWLKKENNAWLARDGKGENGWEEVPYWLRGFSELGYVLEDKRIKDEAKIWIEGIVGSSRSDGWFGPESSRTQSNGKPDMWPNMPALDTLRSHYERTNDGRVLKLMRAYFQYQLRLPDQNIFLSYWEPERVGDNIESIYWLYNRTGEPWLLDLVQKLHRRGADWVGGVPDWHGVNMPQGLREPALYSLATHKDSDREASNRDYLKIRSIYGQVPGGLYGADENARAGFGDPRQAAETCAMVEMMRTCESLVNLTGDTRWADRCEDVAFNSLPASMTADLKSLHYLTSPNMIRCDAASKAPGLQNGGPMLLFNPYDHRCCQHNAAMGWPLFAESLWSATGGDGLAAMFFAPSEVTAKVGGGEQVKVIEETTYPFGETVKFTIRASKSVAFPFVVRIPGWAEGATVSAPSAKVQNVKPGSYVRMRRTWSSGDVVVVKLPRKVRIQTWKANKDSVSVNYGALTFSLEIGQKFNRAGGTDKWPAQELVPTAPWNYGLASLSPKDFRVHTRPLGTNAQPFTLESAPIWLEAKARKIPAWQEDHLGLVGLLQQSPALTKEPVETVRLVPMGTARLRISSFPVTSTTQGTEWLAPAKPKRGLPALASHVFSGDTLEALTDGLVPVSSGDLSIPRFTWWDHKGSDEWVEIDLPKPQTVSSSEVYWFSDEATSGECRVPESWRLFYWNGGEWQLVSSPSGFGVKTNTFNKVTFQPVETTKLRIEAKLRTGMSAGILEWRFK